MDKFWQFFRRVAKRKGQEEMFQGGKKNSKRRQSTAGCLLPTSRLSLLSSQVFVSSLRQCFLHVLVTRPHALNRERGVCSYFFLITIANVFREDTSVPSLPTWPLLNKRFLWTKCLQLMNRLSLCFSLRLSKDVKNLNTYKFRACPVCIHLLLY